MYPNNQQGQPTPNGQLPQPQQPGQSTPEQSQAYQQPAQPQTPAQPAEQPLRWETDLNPPYDPAYDTSHRASPDGKPYPGTHLQPDYSNTPSFPVDYLNEIESQDERPGLSAKAMLSIIGVAVIAVVGFGFFAANQLMAGSDGNTVTQITNLHARMGTLQQTTVLFAQNIKSSELRAYNTEFDTYLGTARADLTKLDIMPKKPSANLKKSEQEYEQILSDKFKEAALNGYIDRVYAAEMNYEIELIHVRLENIHRSTRIVPIREKTTALDKNLETIHDKFSKFTVRTN